jgi:hypothetical protein
VAYCAWKLHDDGISIGYPKGRPAGAAYANQFIEEMKKSGFIQQAIERANLKGAVVPR